MKEELLLLRQFVDAMNENNSTNHKVEVLTKFSEYKFIRDALVYTYHPYKQYNVTSSNLKKRTDLCEDRGYLDLFSLLDALDQRIITGHSAISATNFFISQHSEFSDLLYMILDRNLETRATTTLINRVMPNLIPTFNVALAHDATKVKGVDLVSGEWIVSRKLDGVRCITVIREKGDVRFYSRNGKEFETLGSIKAELVRLGLTNCVLDGEICMMSNNGSDDFQGILKEIQRKDHTIKNPKYWVFDILELDEFESGVGTAPLSERLNRSQRKSISYSKVISMLTQIRIEDLESLSKIKEEAKKSGWEGLIARRDVGYEGERTKNMLKLKEFYDAEYQVIDLIMGPQRIIIEGKEMEEEMLSAVIILHEGTRVRVGSGFSLEQRRHYFQNPNEILGAEITVQYFEKTIDQHGNHSLRFPVFKGAHGAMRTT